MQTLGDFTIDAATGAITVSTAPTFSLTATEENTRTLTIRATDTSTTPGVVGETTTDERNHYRTVTRAAYDSVADISNRRRDHDNHRRKR